jgi:archaellum biogenesis protein FlaJ (TadC family)
MNRSSTLFWKVIICGVAAVMVAGLFGLPAMVGQETVKDRPGAAYVIYLFLTYAIVISVPFFVAVLQGFRLLTYLNTDQGVSESSAGALRQIKISAFAITVLLIAGIVGLMILSRGKGEDITGVVAPALLLTIAACAVAAIAGAFQKRVQRAVDARSEDDAAVGH